MTETPRRSACAPDQDSTSWGSLLIGMLVGAAIGAAASLLYAPKPGNVTRRELLARLEEARDRLDHLSKNASGSTGSRLAEMRADLAQAVRAARVATQDHAARLRERAGLD